MKILQPLELATYLLTATIEQTIKDKHALVHIGKNADGKPFVVIADWIGQSVVAEGR